jgi:hypothetical protein
MTTTTNLNILCIPAVFANIGEDRIRRAFADLDIGEITRVDIVVPKIDATANNKKFNRVFIHINWNDTRQAAAAKEKLSQGKDIKIVYDQPWFWKVSAYKKKEQEPKPKLEPKHKKASLVIEEDDKSCGHENEPKDGNCLECIWILEQEAHRRFPKPPTTQKPAKSEEEEQQQQKNSEAAAALLASIEIKEEPINSTFVMNPDIRLMVATFLGIGRDEVSEEQYRNNSQFVRDLRQDDMDKQKDEDAKNGINPLNYSGVPVVPPKRKRGKIVVDEK